MVIVVSSSPLLRAGLRLLLAEAGETAIHEAPTLAALPIANAHDQTVLLLAAEPDEAILDALAQASQTTSVILICPHCPPAEVTAALRAGVRGVLPLDLSAERLRAALQAVRQGLLVLDPALSPAGGPGETPLATDAGDLTPREREVLAYLAAGLANKEIARRLGVSEHTVKYHLTALFHKLGASSRTEAIHLAARRGWLVF